MYEESVREQLELALTTFEEEALADDGPLPKVSTLREYGMMTSDEGLVLDYGEAGIFTVHIGCYRRSEIPNEEDV